MQKHPRKQSAWVLTLVFLGLVALAAQAQTSLVPAGALWKYLDTGTDEGVLWRAPGYPDELWLEGNAQLGYSNNEENDEATLLRFGDEANKHITYYFRHSFTVTSAASYTNLLLRLLRDDGAVVYLNGTEVFRDNMPEGDITYTTLALNAVDGGDETTNFFPRALDPALLVEGNNVLAVEVHQVSPTSSDVSFDLSLTGNYVPVPPVISIASPENGSTLASALISIVANASDPDGAVASVEFYQGNALLNTDTEAPFSFTWSGMATGAYTLRAVAIDQTALRATSAPVSVTIVTPPPTLIARNATWKYLDNGTDQGTGWNEPTFNDAGWSSGAAELGYGDGDETSVIGFGPDSANKYVTTYFRHTFSVTDPSLYGSLPYTLTYDDGAIIYVNGVQVQAVNMPTTWNYQTYANGAADYSDFLGNLPAGVLVAGNNVVAIEMHQGNATSSDLSMAFALLGNLSPSIVLTAPSPNQVFNLPANITLTANAVDTDGFVSRVEFFEGANKLGEATSAPFSISWTNATGGVYFLTAVAYDNTGGQATSDPVQITVTDTSRPRVLSVSGTTNQLTVEFSKRITEQSATNLANYAINLGVSVLAASLLPSETAVQLDTTFIAPSVAHVITISGVRDAIGQTVLTTNVTFSVVDYAQYDIGGPSPLGSFIYGGNGTITLNASGTNVAGTRDQLTLLALELNTDFDVQVRISGIGSSDPWAQAGLMARESTATGSRHAAVFATPSINGCYFASRASLNGPTTTAGSFPVNFPNTWLRLKRVGNLFTGYVSVDGDLWVQLGSVSLLNAARPMLVGLAGASAVPDETLAIRFTESEEVTGGTIGTVTLPIEPPGPSSRNTGLAITEIMYHPTNAQLEFIEIFNSQPFFQDVGGWRISGSVDYTFAEGTRIPGGGYVVVARNPGALSTNYQLLTPVFGPWQDVDNPEGSTGLPNDEGTVRLRNKANAVLLEVVYEGIPPWPLAADGAGHSLVLARPSYGEGNVRAWAASDKRGGSPGYFDGYGSDPLRSVLINEFLAHTDDPQLDFIELYNCSGQPVDLSGAFLSDDRDTNKFRIPDDTILPAFGFISFDQTQLGFALSSGGERLYFVNAANTRVLAAHDFEAQVNGISTGRHPDGAPMFQELVSVTPGASNSGPLTRDIVINELMYHPITENDDDEFIELYNKGTETVDLSFWKLQGGIRYTIPTNTFLAPDSYLVVARDVEQLLASYPNLNLSNTVGNYSGQLANGSERIALAMPDFNVSTNLDTLALITNVNYVVIDEVTYEDGGRWGNWSDGGGSSLELIDPRSDNRLAANWADSDESLKAPWTPLEVAAPLDNAYPAGDNTINRVQVMILGRGECLVDDIELFQAGGANVVPNGDFEAGLGTWWIGGNHINSTLNPTEGFGGGKSLYVRASAGGDNGGNRIEQNLSSTLPNSASVTATMRCKVRWIAGHPDLLLRVHGGQIELAGTMSVPRNLGSPGARNSRALDNNGPAIWGVTHAPILPAANQAVTVTARVNDPDGVASILLRHRVDPGTTYATVAMVDDGTGADAIANDGLYSATIPGRAAGSMATFYVEATDGQDPAASNRFPNDAPARECHVWFGDDQIGGNMGVYRFWVRQADMAAWRTREVMSNEAQEGTFVYGNFRVIYNAGARYRGSPFIRPGYVGREPNLGNTAYVWTLPDDDIFLGTDELNLDSMEPTTGSGNQRDATGLREITAFWLAEQLGQSFSYQRQVHLVMNGVSNAERGIPAYTDVQQPNSAYIQSWFADASEGEIYKIDDWFEFDTSRTGPGRQGNQNGILARRMTTINGKSVHDKGAYRWSWEKKFNRVLDDDYSSFYALVDAVNLPNNNAAYVPALESVLAPDDWLTAIALRHAVGDWDGYGYDRGKNQFIYKPQNDRFHMLLWDLDFALGCNGGHPPTQNLFQANDSLMTAMYNNVHFRRVYLRALYRMATGPFIEANYRPPLEARHRALVANGINYTSPFVGSGAQGISIPDWINQRRNNILSQIPAATFAVGGAATITAADELVTFTGTAPVQVHRISVNGADYPITWTSVTAWSMQIQVPVGTTPLVFAGYDIDGQLLFSANKTVTYTGESVDPDPWVVINEIMFNPLTPEAEYVELWNTSSTTAFDLSGWRLNGAAYTFPAGSFIRPREYLVLVRDRVAFANAHGPSVKIFDQFGGNLQLDGETLTLERPVPNGGAIDWVAVDKVKYEPARPWPVGINDVVTASSIQLVDASEDNSRPLNWKTDYAPAVFSEAVFIPAVTNEGWIQVTYTGEPDVTSGNFLYYLDFPGSVYIDDVVLVEGEVAEAGPNLIQNPGFESGAKTPWVSTLNASNTAVVAEMPRSGSFSAKFQVDGQAGNRGLFQQSVSGLQVDTLYTLSFWYHTTDDPNALNYRLSSPFRTGISNNPPINVQRNIVPARFIPPQLLTDAVEVFTPGAPNTGVVALDPIPPLWINEVQPNNATGVQDAAGETEPWIEIYNAGTGVVSLANCYLSDNYTNLLLWPFPAGASLNPGEFKVIFADGEPLETTGAEWHTTFRLNSTAGSVALTRVTTGNEVLDYINYANVRTDESYGAFPDGQPFTKVEFYYVTPGGTNDASAPPIQIWINEWMAANGGVLLDPADFDADDWFELYNPNPEAVNLSGWFLTDDPTRPDKYRIPDGTFIAANGYLLFWADEETGQNAPDREVHVNFRLSAGGEMIELHSPGMTLIDSVTFGLQTNNVSHGRTPDGAATLAFFAIPTPRGPNAGSGGDNTPPVLAAIPDVTLILGETVSFTATATDADVPAQALTFTLVAPVPAGASITPAGNFTWTPTTTGPATVTVRVADNGAPAATDTEAFVVTVLSPPTLTIGSPAPGQFALGFDTVPGKTYRVEYTEALIPPNWLPVPGAESIAGTGSTANVTDTPGIDTQRFYRILLLD